MGKATWQAQDLDSIELVLNSETHYLYIRMLFGVYLGMDDLTKADSLYDEYTIDFPEDTAFIEIGRINLERLDTSLQAAYTLSSADSAYLWNLALSDKPESAEAQALLVLLQDTIFEAPLIDTLAEPRYAPSPSVDNEKQASNKNTFLVYPNPAYNELYIERVQPCNCDMIVALYDMFGNLAYSQVLHDQKGRLDVSALTQGIYIVQLKSEQHDFETQKIMVIR